jgi:hypothetical protein
MSYSYSLLQIRKYVTVWVIYLSNCFNKIVQEKLYLCLHYVLYLINCSKWVIWKQLIYLCRTTELGISLLEKSTTCKHLIRWLNGRHRHLTYAHLPAKTQTKQTWLVTISDLKLHASRWPKILKEYHTWQNLLRF